MERIKDIIFLEEPPRTFKNTIYEDCSFNEYNFYKATIENCIFINCSLEEANFSKANVKNCKFINCFMEFSAMTKVSFLNCEFDNCNLWHSNLCHSKIYECNFKQTILRALFKDLEWDNNTFDEETIIESCGGTHCGMDTEIIQNLIERSKRTVDKSLLSS